ncbi:MAG: nucleotidyl transferase, partial [Candidatus Heimdallarchaeota archaeon]
IGKNSYIGTNSLIREFSCIEQDCVIGFSTEIKNSVIQPGTKIGRLSFVGDSVVGEQTKLETGVTTMNFLEDIGQTKKVIKGRTYTKLGAIIGPKSRIGSNTVLLPTVNIDSNQIISPGSVISSD